MIIKRISSHTELDKCIQLSIDNSPYSEYLQFDEDHVKAHAHSFYGLDAMINGVYDGDKLVAWIVASEIRILSSKERVLAQMHYMSNISGYKAVKALRLAHNSMIDFAGKRGITLLQANSLLDDYDLFNSILIRDGWVPRGSTVMRRLTETELATAQQEQPRLGIRRRAVAR